MKKIVLAALLASTLIAPIAAAEAKTAIAGFTGGSHFTGVDIATPLSVGYSFTANQAVTVTSLGVYNDNFQGGSLQSSHDVGIFTTSGVLLTSVTVTPLSTLQDGFRYSSIASLNLVAGNTYLIAAEYQNDSDGDDSYYTGTSALQTASEITFGQAGFTNSDTLAAPGNFTNSNGRFGPNFQFELTTAAVPEPATWAMFIGGFGLIGSAARRRKVNVSFA